MALTTCTTCGVISRGPRCPAHQRGTTTQRGYGTQHQKARATALAARQPGDTCWRCGEPLGADDTALALDHNDNNRALYNGLTHAQCNSGRKGGTPNT